MSLSKSNLLSLAILFLLAFQSTAQTTQYYRHLRYNHVSPHVPLIGIYPISKQEALNTSHYVFTYNNSNEIIEIINNHYHTEKMHPLASIGAYKSIISYANNVETRIFFDKNGKRVTNDREVYKEVFKKDKKGFVNELRFFDLEDNPMESNWGIAYYDWNKYKQLVIEKRFNLGDSAVNNSPYFEFGITGIEYDKKGNPKANYNLNESFQVIANSVGVAVYVDTYDENGNHIMYTYHDKDGKLTMNHWNYAIGGKGYDENGNQISRSISEADGNLINESNTPSNIKIEMADPVTAKDSAEIKETALGYLVALQELNPVLMERVMHKQLAKRTVGYDFKEKKENIRETTYEQMLEFAASWNKSGTKFPFNPSNKVYILDIYNRMASVKLVSDNWVEYLHLVKTNNEWQIVNLFWLHKDKNRYPNP